MKSQVDDQKCRTASLHQVSRSCWSQDLNSGHLLCLLLLVCPQDASQRWRPPCQEGSVAPEALREKAFDSGVPEAPKLGSGSDFGGKLNVVQMRAEPGLGWTNFSEN